MAEGADESFSCPVLSRCLHCSFICQRRQSGERGCGDTFRSEEITNVQDSLTSDSQAGAAAMIGPDMSSYWTVVKYSF